MRSVPRTSALDQLSCGLVVVIFQQPAEPLTTLNWAFPLTPVAGRGKEQHIPLTLLIRSCRWSGRRPALARRKPPSEGHATLSGWHRCWRIAARRFDTGRRRAS